MSQTSAPQSVVLPLWSNLYPAAYAGAYKLQARSTGGTITIEVVAGDTVVPLTSDEFGTSLEVTKEHNEQVLAMVLQHIAEELATGRLVRGDPGAKNTTSSTPDAGRRGRRRR